MIPRRAPFFSVVIPVYNRANVLGATLKSVLAQIHQDFEVVVVDDGSTDDPKKVVDDFADTRIRYLRKDNGGGGSARNCGIIMARGQFVAFLDSDDAFMPHHLARMRGLLEGKEAAAAYARIVVDRGEGRTFQKPPRAIRKGEHMADYLLADRGFVPTSTLVVDRRAALRVRYDESLTFAQDTDFAIRLFLDGCSFVMAEETGAIWRDVPDPARASSGRKGAGLEGWLEVLKPAIPSRAYYGARGWVIAKGIVNHSGWQAFRLYAEAVRKGAYNSRLAIVVFLQIFMSDRAYRVLADNIVALFKGAVWSRADRHGETGAAVAAE